MHKLRAAIVHDTLRMPLNGNDGQLGMHNPFNHIIPGTTHNGQIASELFYGLVVRGIDERGSTV